MNIGIICGYPIPYGMAATTRIFSYSKGLVENGDNVDVWSITPTNFAPELNKNNSGCFKGVSFFYSYKSQRFSNKILHILEIIYSLIILGIKLYKREKTLKYDAFIVSSDSIATLTYMLFCNIFFKHKLIFIFDEYPIPIRKKCKNKIPRWKKIAYQVILNKYSGYVSMTNTLLSFYKSIIDKPGIIISSITDISRFENITKKPHNGDIYNLVYMGNMELSKDNVDNILYSIPILLQKGYNISLFLYGNPSSKDKNILEKIITQENLSEVVHFAYATFDEVPTILSNADILVSSQPNTVRADGGFPTKLGEYLMSETPVLLTDVGELSHYFKNGVHMYFAQPQSPNDFAEKIKFIIDNYDEALKVAQNGKNYITATYSQTAAGQKLHNFLNHL